MTNLTRSTFQAHPFHLVSPSPWPVYTCISLFAINRKFSSGKIFFMPSRTDVSVFSDNTTEKDIQEYKDNEKIKISEFKDRHTEEEIYDKVPVWNAMDKVSAEALRDEIRSDLLRDTAKLKEELREDVGNIIDIIKSSTFTESAKEKLIDEYTDHLNGNLRDADTVCETRLGALEETWDLCKHAEDVDMSSVGSYSDNSEYNGSERSDNNNNNDNEINEENTNSYNSRPNISNVNNRNINSELSPLAFIIEKEQSTSIYDVYIDLSDIEL